MRSTISAQNSADPIFDVKGFQQNHDYFSQQPFEHIDTMTGALVLTFTDLVLPGNAGRDLKIVRTYNSKSNSHWTFGIEGLVMSVGDTWPKLQTISDPPRLGTADGSGHAAAIWLNALSQADVLGSYRTVATDNFWRYDRQTRELWMPDGTYSHFDANGRLDKSTDPFDNRITIDWTAPQTVITQTLGNGQSRTITLDWTGAGSPTPLRVPASVTYLGRRWTYADNHAGITAAVPPVGPGWRYDDSNQNRLIVTAPQGGTVQYDYEYKGFSIHYSDRVVFIQTQVVARRTANDGVNPPAGWTYDYHYPDGGTPEMLATSSDVFSPDGSRTHYEYGRVAPTPPMILPDYPGRAYAMQSRTVFGSDDTPLESETREYTFLPVLDRTAVATRDCAASGLGLPELTKRTLVRDGQSHTTTFTYSGSNCADYHRPYEIVEIGQLQRTTTRYFQYGFTPYVLGRVNRETVVENGSSFERSWTYDLATGFKRSETTYGLTTTFTSTAEGNIGSSSIGGNTTSFHYSYGVADQIVTPDYTIGRGINPDGTVASETVGGRTTLFFYDNNFRITRTQPPGGTNAVSTNYDNAGGRSVTISRGNTFTTTTLDGFGRPIASIDAAGVQATIEYDAEGRKRFESYPFTGASSSAPRTRTDYDSLGRAVKRTNPDGTTVSTAHGPGRVTIVDENGHRTIQSFAAFGNPSEARLVGLTDAADQTWIYSYNALGKLTRVVAPDGLTRAWTYDQHSRLVSETQPESGTTTYDAYDAAGNLTSKHDANGTAFTYAYDGNNRLRRVTAGSQVTAIAYEPGSDNRASATAGSVATTFQYDTAGRLAARTDVIDGLSFSTAFEYDANDNLTRLIYPSGRQIAYSYDNANRIMRVSDGLSGIDYARMFSYHPSGAVTSYQAGNGIAHRTMFDASRYWTTSIDSGDLHLAYGIYDGVGNVRTIGDPRSGYSQTFRYDELDRLVASTGMASNTYTYDVHGNRVDPGFHIDGNTLRLMGFQSAAYGYDANGNLTSAPNTTYTYTPTNQLATVTAPNVIAGYRYDADGWRTKKVVGADMWYQLRGTHGELLTDWAVTGAQTATVSDYIYAGSRLIATVRRAIR